MTERAYNTGPHRPVNGIGNTPSEIEENKRAEERQQRLEEAFDAVVDLDGPVGELKAMAELTSEWWHFVVEARSALQPRDIAITRGEVEILSFALGDLCKRTRVIDCRLSEER